MNHKLLLISSLAGFSLSAQAVTIDFSGASDFADNFRRVATIASSHTVVQSGSLLNVTGATFATNAVAYVYDTTPATNSVQNTFTLTAGQSISVSIDVANLSANAATSSVGFYFVNPTSEASATNFLALLNINSAGGGAHEQFRFAPNATLASAGNAGTLTSGSVATAETGITVSDATFRTITATYTYNSATSVSMSLVAGATTSTITYNSAAALDTVAIGLRIGPNTGSPARTFQLDNFAIVAPIPEPSAFAALAGLGVLGLAVTRRRQVRTLSA